ncbi:hypothetical protein LPW26_17545 [Rhodopseudomonas sp. HC1]|uniref:hypothetical protein n=1 Tax=Rhodopseudomonas infernalis TaxID=2897386 RepID=UPI001EE8BBEE|nr:hypothetical protein [Rhodopseudomonas infernalis]MCG6206455.1 hypothetical protein [Rhodopseudomonas infernalis]
MKTRIRPPISEDIDSIATELRYAGDREMIASVNEKVTEFVKNLDIPPEYRSYIEFGRAVKHRFAHRLSTCLAQKIAEGLRPRFRGILPDETGAKHESRSASASGMKKLDVNYSNAQIGLGLGVSVKTLNFRDEGTGRFTKNVKRLDGELRAEAQDYHQRQPYAVLAALVFMPGEAARDSQSRSSLRHAWEVFERRTGRRSTNDDPSRFERMWLCVYETTPEAFGSCRCFNVENEFPSTGIPDVATTLSNVLLEIEAEFNARNKSR